MRLDVRDATGTRSSQEPYSGPRSPIMRRFALALVVVSVVLAGTSGRRASSASDTVTRFRVATFNIHKGANRQGRYDLERTVEAIQHLDADLVGVQEVMRNHPDFHCDDQPALIAEGLRRRSGRPWTHAHAKGWITEDRQCLAAGRGSDVATEGLAIFAASPILASSSVRLSEGRVGLAVRVAAAPDVPLVVTHLAANRENQRDRIHEIGVLLPWAARQGPGLLIGDFNAQPDSSELGPVMARYRDAWAEAAARGRVDFVLYQPDVGVTLESVDVVDFSTVPEFGEVSDHHPVVATFRRSPPRLP